MRVRERARPFPCPISYFSCYTFLSIFPLFSPGKKDEKLDLSKHECLEGGTRRFAGRFAKWAQFSREWPKYFSRYLLSYSAERSLWLVTWPRIDLHFESWNREKKVSRASQTIRKKCPHLRRGKHGNELLENMEKTKELFSAGFNSFNALLVRQDRWM